MLLYRLYLLRIIGVPTRTHADCKQPHFSAAMTPPAGIAIRGEAGAASGFIGELPLGHTPLAASRAAATDGAGGQRRFMHCLAAETTDQHFCISKVIPARRGRAGRTARNSESLPLYYYMLALNQQRAAMRVEQSLVPVDASITQPSPC